MYVGVAQTISQLSVWQLLAERIARKHLGTGAASLVPVNACSTAWLVAQARQYQLMSGYMNDRRPSAYLIQAFPTWR